MGGNLGRFMDDLRNKVIKVGGKEYIALFARKGPKWISIDVQDKDGRVGVLKVRSEMQITVIKGAQKKTTDNARKKRMEIMEHNYKVKSEKIINWLQIMKPKTGDIAVVRVAKGPNKNYGHYLKEYEIGEITKSGFYVAGSGKFGVKKNKFGEIERVWKKGRLIKSNCVEKVIHK